MLSLYHPPLLLSGLSITLPRDKHPLYIALRNKCTQSDYLNVRLATLSSADYLALVLDRDGAELIPTDVGQSLLIECQQLVEFLLHIIHLTKEHRMTARAWY